MTEPPRPPGEGNPNDPTAPFNPYAGNDPTSGSTPPPPPPGYSPPPGYNAPPPADFGAPAGGYGPPGGGYGAPGGGYGAPGGGYGPPPGGQDDKTMVMVAHGGGALGAFLGAGVAGWIVPLIVLMVKGNQSPYVRSEALKALNFQIIWSIVGLIGWFTVCFFIGVIIIPLAMIIQIVFGVVAALKASNGEAYVYPLSYPLVK